jgi:LacI family transcriptional regulator
LRYFSSITKKSFFHKPVTLAMPVTLKDIAEQSGVSISTVTRVLNGKAEKYRISKETSKVVLRTAKKLKYRPNQLARSLRLKRTQTVGLLAPDIANPFFAYVIRSIQNIASQKGYSLIICDTNEDQQIEIEQTDLLWSKGVDGLIIMPVGLSFRHLKRMVKEKLPVILIDRCFDNLPFSSVVVDNYKGAFEAVEHLIEYGHRRIAIIQGLQHTYTNNGRVRGYVDALKKHRIPVNNNLIVGSSFGRENGYESTKKLLALKYSPSAIFLTSDLIALGALEALSEAKRKIPDDISLVTFDDMDFAPFLISPLTAVAQPKDLLGETAIRMLIEQIDHDGVPRKARKEVLDTKLIIRESVKRCTNGFRQKRLAARAT